MTESKKWYHAYCGKCGMDEYWGLDPEDNLATIDTCSHCGESAVFGLYNEERLGIGRMKFIGKEEERCRG